MAKLIDQLRQLRSDLAELIERDPEQEVTGQALPLIDAVISEARRALPPESTLASQIVEVVSAETIDAGEPLRAADALLIVGQLIAVLAHDPDERLAAADREMFTSVRAVLPSTSGVMTFLRDHDLGAPFRWESVAALEGFARQWDNAEHRFHDPDVEVQREQLIQLAGEFISRLAIESMSEPGGWQAVVSVQHRDDFRLDGRENDIRRVDELNAMATEIYEAHQQLIEVARRKLGV